MRMSRYRHTLFVLTALAGLACALDHWNGFAAPDHFPPPVYDFAANPLTAEGIELGRRLFYDEALSVDSTIACASCHNPYAAFAHTDHDLSHGINDVIGRRNAPPLFNLAWSTSFHHDGAHHSLDFQPLAPLTDPGEMGNDLATVVRRLAADRQYVQRFAAAWGDTLITGERVLKSLAQFQLTLVSAGAKYDRVRAGRDSFSVLERRGYALFRTHCNACHAEPLFTNQTFAGNGLPVDTTLNDLGRMEITGRPTDSLLFKVPSLRNLSFTYPYMHDGRFRTLRQVLAHYAERPAAPRPLSPDERVELTAFLLTLDDREFIFAEGHGFPR